MEKNIRDRGHQRKRRAMDVGGVTAFGCWHLILEMVHHFQSPYVNALPNSGP